MANDKSFKIKNGLSATRYLGTNGTETAGSEGYSLANASYDSKSFSVSSQSTGTYAIKLKPDGLKAYIHSFDNDTTYQYTLSTAYDISTASYDNTSFTFSSQDIYPLGIFFKPDGSKLYMSGNSNDTVYQYTLSTAWDISTLSYDSVSFGVSSQTNLPSAVVFKTDGTEMYVLGNNNQTVFQYSLSTAWDISTASYSSKSYATGTTNPQFLEFNDAGDMFFIPDSGTDTIESFLLSTAWDISTASSDASFSTVSQEPNPSATSFADSGNKMYVVGTANNTIYQYSTVAYTQTLDLSTGHTFSFTPSGATTVSFTNPPASGVATGFTVEVNNSAGGYAITWPSSVKWHLGTAPTATASKEVYTFVTTDGGTTYYGKKAGENLA